MEASALQAPVGLSRQRSTIGLPLLRLRSDEQLVALLRSGHEEAFQVIHDRYRQRLFAYVRQMLPSRQDAEDALQEVFERAYASLLTGDRELALRPWLYRIAHNRCIDHLRRPTPPPPEAMLQIGCPPRDPVTEADCREVLRRLIADVRRLPDQQRSALLMRELGGMSYADLAQALGVTVPAVKSLLVRARVSLTAAGAARDAACEEIRAELVIAHEGRVRPNSMARRHLRDCPGCREFRGDLRGVRRGLLALAPLTPVGVLARLLGGGGTGGAAGSGAAAACSSGAGASGLAGTGGLIASAGAVVSGAGHVATLLAATVVTATGAAAITQPSTPIPHHVRARPARVVHPAGGSLAPVVTSAPASSAQSPAPSIVPVQSAVADPAAPTSAPAATRPHRPTTPASAADNSLGPIPDPVTQTTPPSTGPSGSNAVDPTAAGGTTGATSSGTTGTATSSPSGTTTGQGTGTPTQTTPTPTSSNGGGTPTASGPTPATGGSTTSSGGSTTPSTTGSGSPPPTGGMS